MDPLPSTSYFLKAQLSFSSGVPLDVTCRASMNSLKSMVLLLLVSKVLKTFSLNLSAFPLGNILLYIETNWSLVNSPLGQSFRKPLCHSWNVKGLKIELNAFPPSFVCFSKPFFSVIQKFHLNFLRTLVCVSHEECQVFVRYCAFARFASHCN